MISCTIGGIPEQIDMNAGWLIDREDREKLLSVINNLDKSECLKKGLMARKKVEEYFSIEKCI